jgi:hypothetical protein
MKYGKMLQKKPPLGKLNGGFYIYFLIQNFSRRLVILKNSGSNALKRQKKPARFF